MNVKLLSRDIHSGEFGGIVADSTQVISLLLDKVVKNRKLVTQLQGNVPEEIRTEVMI